MRVAVKDACILIDLVNGELLETWFQLGIETHTTDLVLRQVKADRQGQTVEAYVKTGRIIIHSLSGEQVMQLRGELGHLSVGIEDQSALFLAMQLDAILLTGDRRIRLEGLRKKLEVRGVLWVLDELVAQHHLTPRLAAAKLRKLRQEGAFLPDDECQKRFKIWDSQ